MISASATSSGRAPPLGRYDGDIKALGARCIVAPHSAGIVAQHQCDGGGTCLAGGGRVAQNARRADRGDRLKQARPRVARHLKAQARTRSIPMAGRDPRRPGCHRLWSCVHGHDLVRSLDEGWRLVGTHAPSRVAMVSVATVVSMSHAIVGVLATDVDRRANLIDGCWRRLRRHIAWNGRWIRSHS